MCNPFSRILLLFTLWLVGQTAFAQSFTQIEPGNSLIYPFLKGHYWETEQEVTELTEALKAFEKGLFKPCETETPAFGLTNKHYWFSFEVENQDSTLDWVLNIDFPQLFFLDIYQFSADSLVSKHLYGFMRPFHYRKIEFTNFALPIHLPKGEKQRFFIKAKSDRPMNLPTSIMKKEIFEAHKSATDLGFGIFFGILFGLMVYNTFLFIGLRDINYLLYVLCILGTFIMFAGNTGYSFQFLLPNSPELNRVVIEFGAALLASFAPLFSTLFLGTKRYSKLMDKLLLLSTGIGILCLLCLFILPTRPVMLVLYDLLSVECVLILIAGGISIRKKDRFAIYYVVAWTAYSLLGFGRLMADQAKFPFVFITQYGAEIGATLEVMLLSLALSSKYNALKKANVEAIKRSLDIQKEANETLEQKVQERTNELKQANTELESLNVEISQTNEELKVTLDMVEKQKQEIETKNTNIMASINYSKRIQNAFIPSKNRLQQVFPESFILFMPRDIVSGDFYWISEQKERVLLCVADCTGHGVPGALMSMIGVNLLNQIVAQEPSASTAKLLEELDKELRKALIQNNSESKDGMDCALISWNSNTRELQFAGAHNGLFIVKDNEIEQIKGSKRSIGGLAYDKISPFEEHTLNIEKNSQIYMATDGYQDQFGGSENRKFLTSRLRNLLLEISALPLELQEHQLKSKILDWMKEGKEKQLDDITLLGFRF